MKQQSQELRHPPVKFGDLMRRVVQVKPEAIPPYKAKAKARKK